MSIRSAKLAVAVAAAVLASSAGAVTYSDNFQGQKANLPWIALNDACLTAGTLPNAPVSSLTNPVIPSCSSKGFLTDPDGRGALLLTPAKGNQTGAILFAGDPFPLSQGIQITFTTYTYGGSADSPAKNGADGIVFFLTDGTQDPPVKTGAVGGSMGYDCSNGNDPSDGVAYGYLGLGIDEWGNFLNTGDNGTSPSFGNKIRNGGIYNSRHAKGTTTYGDNSFQKSVTGGLNSGSGPQYQPERIGLRGSGNTNWAWLSSVNPTYYNAANLAKQPSFPQNAVQAVQAACRSAQYVTKTNGNGAPIEYAEIPYNYDAIPGGYKVLPGGFGSDGKLLPGSQPIANNSTVGRNPPAGTPASEVAWPITYKLTISPEGLLNFDYSYNNGAYQTVLANWDITQSNGPLPASLRFGFSAGTGGSYNNHEITCFTASPLQSQSSVGANTAAGKVITDIQYFIASYSQNNWWGSLVADPLQQADDGTLFIGAAANWDAKCVLTGAAPCDSMTNSVAGTTTNVSRQSPADRTLLTSKGLGAGSGVALEWSDLQAVDAIKSALNVPTDNVLDSTRGQNRVAWLRGDRGAEQLATGCTSTKKANPACDLRARTYVLGDIINSSPTFVGAPGAGAQPDHFVDNINASDPNYENKDGAQKYSAFVTSNASRTNVAYVGGNDGYVHGFRAGAVKSDGSFDAANNDGRELVGYMPYDVLMKRAVNLADPLYKHDYLVDATPAAGDVFYNKKWHTWLVGGVGSSGSEIYVLDITDPTKFSASSVIGDWDSTSAALQDGKGVNHLGATVGTPIIQRMHNGKWAVIFASGLFAPPGEGVNLPSEGVYIGLIDPDSGAVTFQFLDTGVTPTVSDSCSTDSNVVCQGGISDVSHVDLDGDGIADYLYAGDTQGNVWRFDVTSGDVSKWSADAKPLFIASDGTNRQPITTAIVILAVRTGLVTRNMLYFGTGQQTPLSANASITYTTGQQTFYGIWDWNMADWNSKATAARYASLKNSEQPTQPITRTALLEQKLDGSLTDATHRYLSNDGMVCWKGDPLASPCTSQNQYGWKFDLPDKGQTSGATQGQQEQIIYNATFIGGAVVVNSAIPPVISAAQCNPGLQTGWTMAFNPMTGGGFRESYFADADGSFVGGGSTISGLLLGGVGTPTELRYDGVIYLVTNTIGTGGGSGAGGGGGAGGGDVKRTHQTPSNNTSRVSWRELVSP